MPEITFDTLLNPSVQDVQPIERGEGKPAGHTWFYIRKDLPQSSQ